MSRINEKLGLGAAGHRKRLDSLSGVKCPNCPHRDVAGYVVRGAAGAVSSRSRHWWRCRACGHAWYPTFEEIATYNARVRERDRIAV